MTKKTDIAGTTLTIARSEILKVRGNRSSPDFNLPTLRVIAGPDMLRFVSIYPGQTVKIGRDESCELILTHGSVSRIHATVVSSDDGTLTLHDKGSTNGTTHNMLKVTEPSRIQVGDQIQIGRVVLRVESLGLNELSHLSKVVERLTLANKDALTGLVTRRFLKEELPNLVIRHELAEVPLAVLFLDLDHFGEINKVYLHDLGDDVLRSVARLMVMHVRDSDICVRYGGEEFLAVLPNCDLEGALQTAERLRVEIQDHDWEIFAENLKVTASLGVSEYRPKETTRDWLRRANSAMLLAKKEGRNRTLVWEDGMSLGTLDRGTE